MTSHLPLNFFYQLPYFLFTSEDPLPAFIRKYLLFSRREVKNPSDQLILSATFNFFKRELKEILLTI
ncbi:hypothetical protein CEE35_02390 [Candidatus Aerophobetes bacterium Ae_b3b]|nr:MAG: hypothetical protein CEE35_02390 [Candidatus Aerophobetes bacterium Ae_b3b]